MAKEFPGKPIPASKKLKKRQLEDVIDKANSIATVKKAMKQMAKFFPVALLALSLTACTFTKQTLISDMRYGPGGSVKSGKVVTTTASYELNWSPAKVGALVQAVTAGAKSGVVK